MDRYNTFIGCRKKKYCACYNNLLLIYLHFLLLLHLILLLFFFLLLSLSPTFIFFFFFFFSFSFSFSSSLSCAWSYQWIQPHYGMCFWYSKKKYNSLRIVDVHVWYILGLLGTCIFTIIIWAQLIEYWRLTCVACKTMGTDVTWTSIRIRQAKKKPMTCCGRITSSWTWKLAVQSKSISTIISTNWNKIVAILNQNLIDLHKK